MEITIETVAALRSQLWDAGFRPVPIYTWNHAVKDAGKRPLGNDWPNVARQDPPGCLNFPPVPHALNTGVLCDGLRAIDIDVDDPEIASRCRSLVVQRFGEAPIRMRQNSPRCLILYRAATGTPPKVVLAGNLGKIEVLGEGQQFVAFGRHPSGAELEWFPEHPGEETLDNLPPVDEAALLDLLNQIAPILEATPLQRVNGHDHQHAGASEADPLRVAAALNTIPNVGPPDWEAWNKVGMAVWRATGGTEIGFQAFDAWSRRHDAYDPNETRDRWDHYSKSPPTRTGAGKLFRLARDESEQPEYRDERVPDDAQPDDDRIFRLEWFRDLEISSATLDFVEGLLCSTSMIVIYGESGCGKTFWTTDLCLHIVCGWPWNGREVDQGGVIYVALEGAHGIRNRVAAFKSEHGLDSSDLPFAVITTSVNMLDPSAHVDQLIQTIRHAAKQIAVPVRLIVFDTLSRAIAGGNENSPEDMGALVTNGARVQEETAAAVAWIHHSGKDAAKGARGHSLLRAATDTEIEVTDDEGSRTARVTKQREMECIGEFSFRLEPVVLGQNSRGKDVTSCIVKPNDDAQPKKRRMKMTGHTQKAFDVLTNLLASQGKSGFPDTPDGVSSVPDEWWRERFYQDAMPGAEQSAKQKAFRRASDALVDGRMVAMAAGRVWLPYGGEE